MFYKIDSSFYCDEYDNTIDNNRINYVEDSLQYILNRLEHSRSKTQKRKHSKSSFISSIEEIEKERKRKITNLFNNIKDKIIDFDWKEKFITLIKCWYIDERNINNFFIDRNFPKVEKYLDGEDIELIENYYFIETKTNIIWKKIEFKICPKDFRHMSLFVKDWIFYVPYIENGILSLYKPTMNESDDADYIEELVMSSDNINWYYLADININENSFWDCSHWENYWISLNTHFWFVKIPYSKKCVILQTEKMRSRVRELVWLITKNTQVRILPPLLNRNK